MNDLSFSSSSPTLLCDIYQKAHSWKASGKKNGLSGGSGGGGGGGGWVMEGDDR